jgi:hypothetical protein
MNVATGWANRAVGTTLAITNQATMLTVLKRAPRQTTEPTPGPAVAAAGDDDDRHDDR